VTSWSGQALNGQQMYYYSGDVAALSFSKNRLRIPGVYSPQPGDFVFFNWHNGGYDYDHIAIVTSVSKDTFTTVEGNICNNNQYYSWVGSRTWSTGSGNILAYATWF